MHSVFWQIFTDHLEYSKPWVSPEDTVWEGENSGLGENSVLQPVLVNGETWVNFVTSLFILLPEYSCKTLVWT